MSNERNSGVIAEKGAELAAILVHLIALNIVIPIELIRDVIEKHDELVDEHVKNHGSEVVFSAVGYLMPFFEDELSFDELQEIMNGYHAFLDTLGVVSQECTIHVGSCIRE